MGAQLSERAREEAKKMEAEGLPPILSEEALEGLPNPDWMKEDPFVRHRESLPTPKSVAIVATGLTGAVALLMWRWNRRAGALVNKYLADVERMKRTGKPMPKPKEATTGEAAWLGLKAFGFGTLLCTTAFTAGTAWTAHYLGLHSTRDFAVKMKSVFPRFEESENKQRIGESGNSSGEEAVKVGENEMRDAFDPLVALFGDEAKEDSKGRKQTEQNKRHPQ
jgi:hypothetical protein